MYAGPAALDFRIGPAVASVDHLLVLQGPPQRDKEAVVVLEDPCVHGGDEDGGTGKFDSQLLFEGHSFIVVVVEFFLLFHHLGLVHSHEIEALLEQADPLSIAVVAGINAK